MENISKVLHGDCLEVLKTLPENSVDSIVTDPPYGLGFMGKEWDTFDKSQFGKKGEEGENDLKVKKNFNILPRYNTDGLYEFSRDWSKECFRVLKPGGYILAFAGTRTYHKITMGIEDAGFEVRDMIEWVYGSGFPKSLNIGKAVDKLQGNEREVLGKKEGTYADIRRDENSGQDSLHGGEKAKNRPRIEVMETKGTSEWEGWGTALKPAHEPICMARKPISEKTVAENCLKYGTGGINIDESRVESKPRLTGTLNKGDEIKAEPTSFKGSGTRKLQTGYDEKMAESNLGRFPANLIHDNSEEVRECFPETKSVKSARGGNKTTDKTNAIRFGSSELSNYECGYDDSGNASRFFKSIIYTAKASKSERNKGCEGLEEKDCFQKNTSKWITDPRHPDGGYEHNPIKQQNNHPTVKPIALMEYLIKMVTPKGGIVLDPFAGSGSTLVAAKQNGYQYIGIELTPEYIPIIEARLNSAVKETLF